MFNASITPGEVINLGNTGSGLDENDFVSAGTVEGMEMTLNVGNQNDVVIDMAPLFDGSGSESLGPNLVANGVFDTDTNWEKTNAVVAGGVGTLNVPASGSITSLAQAIPMVDGETYRYEVDVISGANSVGKLLRLWWSNLGALGLTHTISEGTESVSYDFVANSAANMVFFARGTSAEYSVSVDNVSIRKVFPATSGIAADSILFLQTSV